MDLSHALLPGQRGVPPRPGDPFHRRAVPAVQAGPGHLVHPARHPHVVALRHAHRVSLPPLPHRHGCRPLSPWSAWSATAVLLDFRHKAPGDRRRAGRARSRCGDRIRRGDMVLFNFNCARFYRTPRSHDRPYISHEAIRWLVLEKKISLIGSDASGIELKGVPDQPNHQLLMDNGIPIIEFAANLDALSQRALHPVRPGPAAWRGWTPARCGCSRWRRREWLRTVRAKALDQGPRPEPVPDHGGDPHVRGEAVPPVLHADMPGSMHQYNGRGGGGRRRVRAPRARATTSPARTAGHGHCIAKGADLSAVMAEMFAKSTGCCRGMGGSMHIADFSVGMLGANGIVARRHPHRRRARADLPGAAARARWPWPSSATARPTRAPSTRRSTWRPSGSCRWCSSARTTCTASPRTTGRRCVVDEHRRPGGGVRHPRAWWWTAWTSAAVYARGRGGRGARARRRGARRCWSARPTASWDIPASSRPATGRKRGARGVEEAGPDRCCIRARACADELGAPEAELRAVSRRRWTRPIEDAGALRRDRAPTRRPDDWRRYIYRRE